MSGTAKYSPSRLFKEQIQGLEPDVQDRAIRAATRLARWIENMQTYSSNVKVMNIQVTVKAKMRLVFKYTSDKDKLVARKVLFH